MRSLPQLLPLPLPLLLALGKREHGRAAAAAPLFPQTHSRHPALHPLQPSLPLQEPEDELPFACYICRKPWEECKRPVMTRCKHYFCEPCALKHNARGGKCAACDTATQGIFNVAQDILKKMKKTAERVAAGGGDKGAAAEPPQG